MKAFVSFIHIWFGISLLSFLMLSHAEQPSVIDFISSFQEFDPEDLWGPYAHLFFSIAATCLCCFLNPFVISLKKRKSALVKIILASTILGLVSSICYVQHNLDAEWRTRENIETRDFYTPGMFLYPDSAPAVISDDLKSEDEIKYAKDVLFLSKLYFWKACLDSSPSFLIASWLYGIFVFAFALKRFKVNDLRIKP